jgi:hypothetical protein
MIQVTPAKVFDAGYVANTSSGDKTVIVTDYTNTLNGTMVTALNTVSAGTGTALSLALDTIVLLRKKIQALETSLAAGKFPDA